MLIHAALLCLTLAQSSNKEPVEIPVVAKYFLPPNRKPILALVQYRVKVSGSGREVSVPFPSNYSGQSVVSIKVQTDPPDHLNSWRLAPRSEGLNCMIVAQVKQMPGDFWLSYTARVAVPGEEVIRTQRKNFKDWLPSSEEVRPSADCRLLARQFNSDKPSRAEFVSRAVKRVAITPFVGSYRGQSFERSLEGRRMFKYRACLCAEVLRANGIPARTLSYFPTWGERLDALAWAVEYENEDHAWEMVEPTIGIVHPARNSAVVVDIPSVAEEESAWNLPETSIKVIRSFPFQSGPRLMTAAHRYSVELVKKATEGKETWIDDALLEKILKKGPINLALYLDGQPTIPDPQ